jgi:hypothetical protein
VTTDLHPDVQSLAFLLGTWKGKGRGEYPTIDGFEYDEEITISHVGKPFLHYHQRTWSRTDGAPLHTEAGYYRSAGDGVELIIAQPSGIAEVQTGTLRGATIDLKSTGVLLAPTAKQVVTVGRRLEVTGAVLGYRLDMEAVGQPLQFHLEAELHRLP